jgi:serine/threonine protein kinase/tetratricopeptide (TPR) repeat protein
MDQQRWKKIKTIFNAAIEIPASERNGFVRNASDGDPELESELLRLLLADEQAGSYLESPVGPDDVLGEPLSYPPSLQVGDVLCQRFRIDRLIGSGGMGHVFEAWDTVLRVRIALKTVRPEIAESPAALARFRQEVLTARSLSHPNICRTFDFERETRVSDPPLQAQSIVFLTMEFLEGETLENRITRAGALDKDEALVIARQIAGALSCAHDHGIVHGDIKPANIMLVRRERGTSGPIEAPSTDLRVVITDFGLARVDPLFRAREFSTTTRSILPGGTLAYMAPEQLEGSPISSATDIYAFGLVLFEMITGQRAFPSENLLAGIAQRVAGQPPSPQVVMRALSNYWIRAIEGCLRIDPSQRLQAANHVVSILEGSNIKLPARRRSLLDRSMVWKWRKWTFVSASIFFIIVASFFGILRLYQSRANSESAGIAPGRLVYLTEVRNNTGEKSLDNLTELIRAGLTQSAQATPLTQDRIGDTLQQMTKPPDTVIDPPIARDIALRTGAVRIIFADTVRTKDGYALNVDIQQPDNTPNRFRNHWSKQFRWSPSGATNASTFAPELLAAMREASSWIRHEVGESANDIARLDVPPADVTTNDWQALAAYTKAENLSAKGQKEDALVALKDAIHIDPQFALAYARIGDIAVSLGRTHEGFAAYDQALGTDFDRRLTRRELDRIRGIYASDSWDYQTAESSFRDYTIYYEHDYAGWFYRALPLMRLGRTDEAVQTLRKAYAIDPHRVSAVYDLAICYMEMGDLVSAEGWINVLRQLHDVDNVALLEGTIDFLNSRYQQAEDKFLSVRSSQVPTNRLKALSFLTRLSSERGEYAQSLAWSDAGIKEAAAQGNDTQRATFLMDRAYIQCFLRQEVKCLRDAEQSLLIDKSPGLLISAGELYGREIAGTSGVTSARFRAALQDLIRHTSEDNGNVAVRIALQYLQTEVLVASRRLKESLKEARRTSAIDQQFARKSYLARALALAAQHEPVLAKRQAMLKEARDAYAKTALRPSVIWTQPGIYPPGTFAEDLADYVRISLYLKANDEEVSQAQKLYEELRPGESVPQNFHTENIGKSIN